MSIPPVIAVIYGNSLEQSSFRLLGSVLIES